jgi:putative spermidine/putrescine transport system permease protein
MKPTWKVKLWRYSIIFVVGFYLLLPIYSMLDFSTKPFAFFQKGRTLDAWKVIPSQPDLTIAIFRSLVTAAIVMFLILVLIVPTVVWVHLKLPKLKRLVELICLIPLAIPAIVIVVGISPLYRWISINISESPITLSLVYSMLILPYTYRALSAALDAADISILWPRQLAR